MALVPGLSPNIRLVEPEPDALPPEEVLELLDGFLVLGEDHDRLSEARGPSDPITRRMDLGGPEEPPEVPGFDEGFGGERPLRGGEGLSERHSAL